MTRNCCRHVLPHAHECRDNAFFLFILENTPEKLPLVINFFVAALKISIDIFGQFLSLC